MMQQKLSQEDKTSIAQKANIFSLWLIKIKSSQTLDNLYFNIY